MQKPSPKNDDKIRKYRLNHIKFIRGLGEGYTIELKHLRRKFAYNKTKINIRRLLLVWHGENSVGSQ